MSRKILLTGRPGYGKTTLIKRVAQNLAPRLGVFLPRVQPVTRLEFSDHINVPFDSELTLSAVLRS